MSINLQVVFYLLCTVIYSFGRSNDRESSTEKVALKTLYTFYTDYFKIYNQNPSIANQIKMDQLVQKYCSKSFYKKIPQLTEQTGADVFLKAQDSDIQFLKTLKIAKTINQNEYLVSYLANGNTNQQIKISIYIQLLKQGNQYKINSVR